MQRRREKNEEDDPVVSWFDCALAPEITVMAASGLWQDLREGLGQAELLCSGLLEKRRAPAWCGQVGRQVQPPDFPDLPWRNARRGGEQP